MNRRTALFTLGAFSLACSNEEAPVAEQAAPEPQESGETFTSLMPRDAISEHWKQEGGNADTWTIRDGMIYCAGKPNSFLRSNKIYRDFVFRAEWRFITEGWLEQQEAPDHWPNAGFFIMANEINDTWPRSLEVQGHYGEAGSLFGVRGGEVSGARRGPIDEHRIPFGDWDKVEVRSEGGIVTVILNDRKINEGHEVSPEEGNICLQSEGWPLWYRDVEIREL